MVSSNTKAFSPLRRLLPLAFLYLLISFGRKIGKQKFFAWVFIHAFCGVAFKCFRNVRIVSQHQSGPVTYPAWENLTPRYEPRTTQRWNAAFFNLFDLLSFEVFSNAFR